ncbi:MAG: hypothetical protein F2690_01610 [Actinobacteria bacterium]|uniref:Unannotated protein n=1 Tax=freshwater metagenome TaxID=449393 RepID=A0A6J6RJF8_9ZZZZ|nr:hypothetical protein [Actinomycetota bacterium]MSX45485.1 hypothetical protein [Actinomycetota bacterium]MSX71497.1 hypothetical protein [Actinomycetota bacterium]MSY69251.1 hypothetical protein [Actinomycetota bacterium]MTA75426.1 hypothetical protein [Actinomycetota bacterium]
MNRVIIYGVHSQDWMDALHPDSALWDKVENADVVINSEALQNLLPFKSSEFRDVIIPLMETHIRETPSGYACLVPDSKSLDTLQNKQKFDELLGELSLSKYAPQRLDLTDSNVYPIVLKRIDLNGGVGIELIRSESDLMNAVTSNLWTGQNYILQEYIQDFNEFVWHAVYKDGIKIWDTTFKYIMESNEFIRTANSKFTIKRVSLDRHSFEVFDSILGRMNYSGPCNIDFKFQGSDLKIFEINPRLGGSLMKKENHDLLAECLTEIINVA